MIEKSERMNLSETDKLASNRTTSLVNAKELLDLCTNNLTTLSLRVKYMVKMRKWGAMWSRLFPYVCLYRAVRTKSFGLVWIMNSNLRFSGGMWLIPFLSFLIIDFPNSIAPSIRFNIEEEFQKQSKLVCLQRKDK